MIWSRRLLTASCFSMGLALLPVLAFAQEQDTTVADRPSEAPKATIATETPTLAFAHSAFGVSAGTVGGAGYGEATGAFRGERPSLGGGLRAWGAPIDWLTLFVDAERRDEASNRRFAPSASVQGRILGDRAAGWALSGLVRYKADGFADLGGEMEFAVLGSYARRGFHLDGNVIVGAGFEEGESDGELLARIGYDVLPYLRIGGEGRLRYRLSGDASLPGGRAADVYLGPQLLGYYGAFFAAVSGGPSTIGIADGAGWFALASIGGAAF